MCERAAIASDRTDNPLPRGMLHTHAGPSQAVAGASRTTTAPVFTLIELLVVISIVMALVAVLVPVTQKARSHARTVACRSNLRQWAFATTAYANDHSGEVPGFWWGCWSGGTSLLESYVRDHKPLYLCPAATRHRQDSPLANRGDKSHAWWQDYDGAGTLYSPIKGSYAFSGWVQDWSQPRSPSGVLQIREDEVPLWRAQVARCWQTMDVQGAYRVPLIADSAGWTLTPCDTDSPPAYEGDTILAPPERLWDPWRDTVKNACMDRHSAGVNMAFLDASTRKVDLKELWTLRWHRQYNMANVWTRAGDVSPEDWPLWMRKFKEH